MGIKYRTIDSGNDYEFDFVRTGHAWRIDIRNQPSYGARSTSAGMTHRLGGPGSYFICWDRPIPTLGQAKTIAVNWAEGTDRYIRTGNSASSFGGMMITDFAENASAAATFARLEAGHPQARPGRGTTMWERFLDRLGV
jgi:hypothetical protein